MNQKKLVVEILNYIDNNIYKKITIKEISRIFYFNKDYIMRLFKKELNLTIFEYINKKKIYLSLYDLKYSHNSILKVAINNGFSSQEYYSETFKKILMINPNTYRKFTKVNTLSFKTLYLIRENLTKLKLELDKIERYKNSIPQETVKKLSLYK